jgi:hypothetical protein
VNLVNELNELSDLLNEKFRFSYHDNYGYYNKNIENLGLAIDFSAEFCAKVLLNNNNNNPIYEKIKESFMNFPNKNNNYNRFYMEEINNNNNNNNNIGIYLRNSLTQNVNNFYKECLEKLFNFEYLITNINNNNLELPLLDFSDIRRENLILSIYSNSNNNLNSNNNSNTYYLQENFFIEKAYKKLHNFYKFSYLPNKNNFNNFVINLINGNFNKNFFDNFPLFFEEIFNKFSELNTSNISNPKFNEIKKAQKNENEKENNENNEKKKNQLIDFKDFSCFSYPYSTEDFKMSKFFEFPESLKQNLITKLYTCSNNQKIKTPIGENLKNITIKIHRNFKDFNLPDYLNETELNKVRNNIEDSLFLLFDKYIKINDKLFEITKFFNIHINNKDHLIFEFNSHSTCNNKNLLKEMENFLEKVSLICINLYNKNHEFSFINNVGYLVSDFSLLALGLEFYLEFDLKNINKELFEKDFNYHKAKYPNGLISLSVINTKNSDYNNDNNNDINILGITNNRNFEGFLNTQGLRNIIEKSVDFLGNLKMEENIKNITYNDNNDDNNNNEKSNSNSDSNSNIKSIFNSNIDENIKSSTFDFEKNVNLTDSININVNINNNNNNLNDHSCCNLEMHNNSIEGSFINLNDSIYNSERFGDFNSTNNNNENLNLDLNLNNNSNFEIKENKEVINNDNNKNDEDDILICNED